jgi:hypothetical protein
VSRVSEERWAPMISRRIWNLHGSGRIIGWQKQRGSVCACAMVGDFCTPYELHEHTQARTQ